MVFSQVAFFICHFIWMSFSVLFSLHSFISRVWRAQFNGDGSHKICHIDSNPLKYHSFNRPKRRKESVLTRSERAQKKRTKKKALLRLRRASYSRYGVKVPLKLWSQTTKKKRFSPTLLLPLCRKNTNATEL